MQPNQSKFYAFLAVLMIAAVILSACAPAAAAAAAQTASKPTILPNPAPTQTAPGIDPLVFRQAVRKLWEDHITWTRVYIIGALAGLPETDTAAQRLLQNQADIGNAIKPFYGEQAGNQLTALLREHILTAADLLAAAKSGDKTKLEAASKHWYENGNQIAAFLHAANPDNWMLGEMQAMMKSHLDLTLAEATARLNQDWAGDVTAYDQVHAEILDMADSLSSGIIKQFPGKFAPMKVSNKVVDLTLAMNKLWEDHVTWTRVYIISVTSGLPDTDAATQRLLQNQTDIGTAIKPLYGEQAGDQLTKLLREHILTAAALLAAAKSGDQAKFDAVNKTWYENANQIAAFLNKANPDQWPLNDMQNMMKTHLDLTLGEATARLKGDWTGDVVAYDRVHSEILQMAGMLTDGIVAQFSNRYQ